MQRVEIVKGVVKGITRGDTGEEGDFFWWPGPPLNIGDPDPRPEGVRNANYDLMNQSIALMGSTEPVPYAVQKWLELYGDWLNELNFAIKGKYRSQQELVGEWVSRTNGTFVPPT